MDKKQVNRDIFRMVLPIVIENVLQMLAGLVTTAMIGWPMTSRPRASATGSTTPFGPCSRAWASAPR